MKTQPTSKYRRAYGCTLAEIAAKLKCSRALIQRLHRDGLLQAILDGTCSIYRLALDHRTVRAHRSPGIPPIRTAAHCYTWRIDNLLSFGKRIIPLAEQRRIVAEKKFAPNPEFV